MGLQSYFIFAQYSCLFKRDFLNIRIACLRKQSIPKKNLYYVWFFIDLCFSIMKILIRPDIGIENVTSSWAHIKI